MKKIVIIVIIIALIAVALFSTLKTIKDDKDYSKTADVYMGYAEEQIKLGGYGSAIDYIKAALKVETSFARYHRLAEVYRMAEDYKGYTDTMENLINRYPKEQQGYKELAQYYYDQLSLDRCVKVLKAASSAGVMDQEMADQYYAAAYYVTVVSAPFTEARMFYTNYALIKVEELTTYVDASMHSSIGQFADAASCTTSPIAAVYQDDHWCFVNSDSLKYMETETKLLNAWSFSNNLALVQTAEGFYFYNTHGTVALGPFEDASSFNNGVAAVKKGGVWQFINNAGQVIGDGRFDKVLMNEDRICSCCGIFFASTGNGYDMYGADGKLIAATGFEDADIFYFDNYAAAKKSGKWGFVDKTGKIIIEPKYAGARSFGHGIGAVCNDSGKWGFVIASDRLVIDYQYLDAKSFGATGCAPVKIDTGWVYIRVIG